MTVLISIRFLKFNCYFRQKLINNTMSWLCHNDLKYLKYTVLCIWRYGKNFALAFIKHDGDKRRLYLNYWYYSVIIIYLLYHISDMIYFTFVWHYLFHQVFLFVYLKMIEIILICIKTIYIEYVTSSMILITRQYIICLTKTNIS